MNRLTFVLAALLFWPGFGRTEEVVKEAKAAFDLLKTQHMVVEAKINGKGPYRLIFDTGAPVTLINNKIAREAGVIPKNFKRPPFALFGNVGQFTMKTLDIGGVRAADVPTMVMDHPTVTAISNALGPIEGIIGFSFFARYRMTIDYQTKEMTFVPNRFDPPDMMEHLLKVMTAASDGKRRVVAPAGLLGIRVAKEAGDEEAGVTIREVFAGSPAATAGLKSCDRLLTLDGRWTDSVVDCYEAASKITAGSEVQAVIGRDGQEKTITLKTAAGI